MKYWLLMIGLMLSLAAQSSDLQVGEVRIINHKRLSVYLGWRQCWNLESRYAPFNHDAVYLFLKGKHNNEEAKTLVIKDISFNTSVVTTKKKSIGVLIETKTQSDTLVSFTAQIELLEPLIQGNWDISAYAIEMAYIPEGSFWLGDSMSNNTLGSKKGRPLLIDGYSQPVFQKGDTVALSNNPVTGFGPFYLMKQEISQAAYTDFLNNIPNDEANTLAPIIIALPLNSPQRNRCFISKQGKIFGTDANQNGILDESNDGGALPCNWLTNRQLLAYLSWAGLRPITELEFEKACRGPHFFKPKEFAWGTTTVTDANTLSLAQTKGESALEKGNDTSGLANHALLAGNYYLEGPIRSGFAFTKNSNRISAGSGYYGNADLSGNLWEQCLKVQHDALLPLGNGTTNYPKEWGSAVNYIPKGGAWLSLIFNIISYGFRDLAISDRFYFEYDLNEPRGTVGGRGAL